MSLVVHLEKISIFQVYHKSYGKIHVNIDDYSKSFLKGYLNELG